MLQGILTDMKIPITMSEQWCFTWSAHLFRSWQEVKAADVESAVAFLVINPRCACTMRVTVVVLCVCVCVCVCVPVFSILPSRANERYQLL